MLLLATLFLAQIGLPYAMISGGAAPTATPTAAPTATPTRVATPVLFPAGGFLGTSVRITDVTSGSTIFYTVSSGGSVPSHSGPTPLGSTLIYSAPFVVSGGSQKIVEALGYKAGLPDSLVATGTFQSSGGSPTPPGGGAIP